MVGSRYLASSPRPPLHVSTLRIGGLLALLVMTGCVGELHAPPEGSDGADAVSPPAGPAPDAPSTPPPETPDPGDAPGSGGDGSDPGGSGPPPPPFDDGRGVPPPMPPAHATNPAFLDPSQLFSCQASATSFTPQRRWRLSSDQFVNSAHAFAGSSRAQVNEPFGFTPTGRLFNNYAEVFTVAESQLNGVLRGGRKAALWSLRDNKLPGCARSAYRDAEAHEPPNPLQAFPTDCQVATIRYGYARLIGREATPADIDALQPDMAAVVQLLGVRRGVPAALTLLFSLPDFLFRSEVGVAEPAGDVARLSAFELGAALSFGLRDRNPWAARITDVIEDGTILDPSVRRATVRELMDSSQFEEVIQAFLLEYFQYRKGSGIQKDGVAINTFNQANARMTSFMDWLSQRPDRFLEQLFTATQVFEGFNDEPVGNDPQRPGAFTRQAWLWSFSRNTENDPIKRGHFIREHILCQGIPSIPIDVVPQLPEPGPQDTLRDQLAVHSEGDRCWGCHQMMDPLGLPLEQFDHFGNYRSEEKGRPVETSGAFYLTQNMDGAIADPIDMMNQLTASPEVEQCFIRHLFRYFMGRDETYGDACTLADAHQAYRSSNGSLKATVESLMMSDTMLFRAIDQGGN